MPIVRRSLQRGVLHQPALLNIRALAQQQLHHLGVTVTRRENQRRITAVIALIDRRALVNVFLHPIVVPIDAIAPDV